MDDEFAASPFPVALSEAPLSEFHRDFLDLCCPPHWPRKGPGRRAWSLTGPPSEAVASSHVRLQIQHDRKRPLAVVRPEEVEFAVDDRHPHARGAPRAVPDRGGHLQLVR